MMTAAPIQCSFMIQCSFEGCTATIATRPGERPLGTDWMEIFNCRGGFPDGWYCPEHTAWLDALHEGDDGEGDDDDPEDADTERIFDEPQSGA